MELPSLPFKLPEITLPFDIPVLMHPPVDHFVIAIPVIVLLLEIMNLFVKKRAIGVTSFFLLLLGVAAAVAAYLTGTTDGKEAFDALTQAGQADLKAHKLLGTYLMFASVVVLVFKLLSAMVQRGLMKALYFLILILFVIGLVKQGKEGGELVYKYGANVERVQDLDSELFDTNEEIDELKEKMKSTSEKVVEKATEVKEAVTKAATDVAEKTSEAVESAKESASAAVETAKEKSTEALDEAKVKSAEVIDEAKTKGTEMIDAAKEKAAEVVAPAAVEAPATTETTPAVPSETKVPSAENTAPAE